MAPRTKNANPPSKRVRDKDPKNANLRTLQEGLGLRLPLNPSPSPSLILWPFVEIVSIKVNLVNLRVRE